MIEKTHNTTKRCHYHNESRIPPGTQGGGRYDEREDTPPGIQSSPRSVLFVRDDPYAAVFIDDVLAVLLDLDQQPLG